MGVFAPVMGRKSPMGSSALLGFALEVIGSHQSLLPRPRCAHPQPCPSPLEGEGLRSSVPSPAGLERTASLPNLLQSGLDQRRDVRVFAQPANGLFNSPASDRFGDAQAHQGGDGLAGR